MMTMPPPSGSAPKDSAGLRRYLWPVSRSGSIRLLIWVGGVGLIGWLGISFSDGVALALMLCLVTLAIRAVCVLTMDGVTQLRCRWLQSQSSAVTSPALSATDPPVTPEATATAKAWYLRDGDDTRGPLSLAELQAVLLGGKAAGADYVWQEGWLGWRKLEDVAELTALCQPAPSSANSSAATLAASPTNPAPQPTTFHLLLKYGTICFCGLLGFLLAMGFLFGSGRGPAEDRNDDSASAPAAPPAPPQPLRPEQVAERLRQSTVRIDAAFKVKGLLFDDTHAWLGSGVILEKNADTYWILSNAHVVGSDSVLNSKLFMDPVVLAYGLVVTMPDGKQARPVEVRINQYLKDFALIAVSSSTGNYPALPSNTERLPQGQKVFAMGHPMGLNDTFTSGVISSWRTTKTRNGRDCEVIQTDATINSGNSGGPLVDDYAKLIGINTFTLHRDQQAQGLNFAVSAGEIARSIKAGEMITFPLEPSRIGPFVLSLNRGSVRQ